MFTRIAITLVAVAALATPVQAELKWGAFKDNGCINPLTHPGLRSQSAVLWGIPPGQSWEDTCAATGATIDGVRLPHPAACVNTNAADPVLFGAGGIVGGIACGAASIAIGAVTGADTGSLTELCGQVIVAGAEAIGDAAVGGYYNRPSEAIARQGRVKRWPFRVPGAVTPSERSTWKTKLAAAVARNGVGQVKMGMGGLNIWGVFAVPDDRCLPPNYLGLKNASHIQAAQACNETGLRLCRRDELCDGGKPVMGRPEGDVWAAVHDRPNAWVSIGTAWPERLCRTHEEALGQPASWGTVQGPMPVTGKPTTFRCCR